MKYYTQHALNNKTVNELCIHDGRVTGDVCHSCVCKHSEAQRYRPR